MCELLHTGDKENDVKEPPASAYSGGAMIVIRTVRGRDGVTRPIRGGHYEPNLLQFALIEMIVHVLKLHLLLVFCRS